MEKELHPSASVSPPARTLSSLPPARGGGKPRPPRHPASGQKGDPGTSLSFPSLRRAQAVLWGPPHLPHGAPLSLLLPRKAPSRHSPLSSRLTHRMRVSSDAPSPDDIHSCPPGSHLWRLLVSGPSYLTKRLFYPYLTLLLWLFLTACLHRPPASQNAGCVATGIQIHFTVA